MTILLAGATGLVGGLTLDRLLARGDAVVSIGRRKSGKAAAGLREMLVDFAALPALPKAEAAVCALGTTMAAAGSREAFRAVDRQAVLAFAGAAQEAGATRLVVITAVGADSGAHAFYSRVKGEVEEAVRAMKFVRTDFVRPGLIIGPRSERRPMERFFQWASPAADLLLPAGLSRFASIPAAIVADAIVNILHLDAAGVFLHHNKELRALGSGAESR